MSSAKPERRQRAAFWKIAGAGATFQAGSSGVDSATVVASLVYQLTGSAFAVGAASAVLRLGWLLPQFVVGYMAERAPRRMPFYSFGAYGRAGFAALIALLLWFGNGLSTPVLAAGFLLLWTGYAFISGVVAVPYNDIVGRSIPGSARSRMLAWRFFGGGLLAIVVAGFARSMLQRSDGLQGYALIFAVSSILMILSASLFVSAGEPAGGTKTGAPDARKTIGQFIRGGVETLRADARFRLFLYSQWLGGATLMALPFYMVAATDRGISAGDVGLLLGAQTVGALLSNPIWGRLGDRRGKLALLRSVCVVRLLPPTAVLALLASGAGLAGFVALFVVSGAMMNGVTIGYLGYLMEISPDDRRPAYSAYFNTLAAPAALLPLAGAALVSLVSIQAVFIAAIAAALWQIVLLGRIARLPVAAKA
jgi:MFS family permease